MFETKFVFLNIFIPIIGAGIIFSGLLLSFYVYIHWKNKVYLAMFLIGIISFIFVLSEGLLITFSYILDKPWIGRQFHRVEQIAVLYYLFALPFFLTYYLKVEKTLKRINLIIAFSGLFIAVLITIAAFVKPEFYISINNYAASYLGRSKEGLLYTARDIYFSIIVTYYLVLCIIMFIKKFRDLHQAVLMFSGLIIAIFSAIDDTIWVHYGFHIGLFPSQMYSRFALGTIIFTSLTMIGLSRKFIEDSKKVDTAFKQLDKSQEELSYVSYHDQLTGLMNRKSFYERFEDSIVQAKRSDVYKMRGLLFIDLDNFKDINDAIGYEYGDEILKEVSQRIKLALRESDYFFRFGSDEFTVILNSLNDVEDAAIVAQRIINYISNPFNVKSNVFYLGISIGITLFPLDGGDINTLMKNADTALNEAKKDHNVYKYYTKSMEEKAVKKLKMITDLRAALERKEFTLHYQPIQNLNNEVIGAEALIRWNHPVYGMIPPVEFIPVAEDSMLIIPIGQWVLEQACKDLEKIHKMGYDKLFFSINLSIKQFREPHFVDTIKAFISNLCIKPEFIHLEITESYLMKDTSETVEKLNSIREMGIKLSIDDFGTGYSSFSYLETLPINAVKIERCFISPIPDEKRTSPLVEAIILLARKLGLEVITEGVETKEQLNYLKSIDSNIIIQGYYYSKPLKMDDFINYLNNNKK